MDPLLHKKWKWRLYTIFLYAKIMQTRETEVYLRFPERSLSYAKIMQDECNGKTGKHRFTWLDTAESQLILCKDNVNSCSDKINYGCFMHA